MNRRGFLQALLGAAAAPIVGKLMLPVERVVMGIDLAGDGEEATVVSLRMGRDGTATIFDIRRAQMENISRWFAEEVDKAFFVGLQWMPEEIVAMELRAAPPLEINMIRPA